MSGDLVDQVVVDALVGRRYHFAFHGQSQVWPGRQQRSGRRRSFQRTPYTVTNPEQFSLGRFSRPENLMQGFRILRAEGGRAPGNDRLKYEDFSRGEIWEAMRCVSRAILAGTYCPHETRLIEIPKHDGRQRRLLIMNIVDRAVSKSLQICLAGYWESVLPNLRRGVWGIYAEMEQTIRQEGRYILTAADVRDCFPSIVIEDALHCHRQHFRQSELLRLIETLIRGHEGPDHTRGLDQGSPYSPVSAELTLHHCLDRQLDIVAPRHPPLFRYVDNLQLLNSSAQESRGIQTTIQEILEQHSLTLKEVDGDPIDLRDPNHGQTVLGLIPTWKRDLHFSIPESAFQKMENGLTQALNYNHPTHVATQIVEGWLRAIGPAFLNTDARNIIRRVMENAAGLGFREFSQERLLRVTDQARKSWLEIRRVNLSRRQSEQEVRSPWMN